MPSHEDNLRSDLEALERALASGVQTVRYSDRTVTYNSPADLIRARNEIKKILGDSGSKTIRLKMSTSKGLE